MGIREAIAGDAPGIARVHVDSWRTTYRGMLPDAYLAGLSVDAREQRWAERIADPNGGDTSILLVAEEAGQIVGFVSGGPERSQDPAFAGELYALYLLA